ncbi:MAG: hypothetical protein HQK77_19205 [Desulfobacterales bacterium]|nr:hypothetical protein [Desulfobacterales bacterium]
MRFTLVQAILGMVIGLVVMIGISGCAFKPVKTLEFGYINKDRYRILLAAEASAFKDTLATNIACALKNRAYIKMVDVNEVSNESSENYHVIILINTCVAFHIDRQVSDYLEKITRKDNVILITTAGDADWNAKISDVDAITSASTMDKVDPLTDHILDKIDQLLKKTTL